MVSYKVVKVKFFEAEPLILFATFIAEDRGLLKLKVIEYVALCLDIFKVHYTPWPVFLAGIDPGYLSLLGAQFLRRGGEKGYASRIYAATLHPEVQRLTLLYTLLRGKVPLSFTFLSEGTHFTYSRTLHLFSS